MKTSSQPSASQQGAQNTMKPQDVAFLKQTSVVHGFGALSAPHFPSPRPRPQHRDAIGAGAPSWEVKLS
uniref:Alternative protein LOC283486 n=1 Tax=Homo sapiens TaxID=9606 RepID=L8E9X4_HUMAN|nr:alternative protein LOC283486 [Homo sapiens]